MQELELAGIPVQAYSVGGIETCIHLPRYKIAFDIGKCPEPVVNRERILFTHGHMDHMGGVAYHCSTRALRNMRPATYGVPRAYAEKLEALFEAWRHLDHSEMPHQTLVLEPGDELELSPAACVRPFRTYHSAPSQGYAVWSRRHKLLPEFVGLSEGEIRHLRVDEGRTVTGMLEEPEVAYCGDTTVEVVEREEVVRKARLLILECTFIDERIDVEGARSRGHIHLDEIAERAELFENEAILLHHFSPRFKAHEIRAQIRARLPENLAARVTPLLAGFK